MSGRRPDPPPAAGPRSLAWWPAVVSLAALAAALAGSALRPVWHDELYTLALARLPLAELVAALRVDSGPPFHYLLCHLLYLLIGWPEGSGLGTFVVRLPSALAFAAVPWVVWLGARSSPAARFWGPLLSVSWLPLLYFASEARAYALLALVNAVVWILGPGWIARGRSGAAAFAALAACLPLLHYTGFVSLAFLPALAVGLERRHLPRLLMAVAAASLPALAWMPVMLAAPAASMAWVAVAEGPGRPGLATFAVLAPAGPYPALFELAAAPVPAWLSLLAAGSLATAAAAGALVLGRRAGPADREPRRHLHLALALIPALAIAALALAGLPVYFAGRTEAMVWAPLAALVALWLLGLPPVARNSAAGAYAALGLATALVWLAELPARPPAPGVEVGRALAPMIQAHDRVLVAGLWQLELRHGLAEASPGAAADGRAAVAVETLPRAQAGHPGWLDRQALMSPRLLDEALALAGESRTRGNRVWLVWSPALPLERNLFPAFAGWGRQRVLASPIIAVDLLEPPPRSGTTAG